MLGSCVRHLKSSTMLHNSQRRPHSLNTIKKNRSARHKLNSQICLSNAFILSQDKVNSDNENVFKNLPKYKKLYMIMVSKIIKYT